MLTLFIIGCILGAIVIIGVPTFCFILIKKERYIKQFSWRIYVIIASFIIIAIVSLVCVITAGVAGF